MFKLPPLPYPIESLEPHISSETLTIHHGKHHATYIAKLNEILEGSDGIEDVSLEELLLNYKTLLPQTKHDGVIKNGAQAYNHSLYWLCMSPSGGGEPEGELRDSINNVFGSFDEFKKQFISLGLSQFGSGWVWLSLDQNNTLVLDKTSNEDTPLIHNKTPLLTMDVWEHAYYIDYQNRRADYCNSFFNIIDWKAVERRMLDKINQNNQ